MKNLNYYGGVPGSGKSTWAKEYANTHPNTLIVDTDEVRKSVTGSYQVFPPDRHILYDKMIAAC
jgi:DNA transposition AAA+ family ATPase